MPRVPKIGEKKTGNVQKGSKKPPLKKKDKQLTSELKSIYTEGGKMPNLTKLEKTKSSALTRFLFRFTIIAFILAAVAWAGFLYFQSFGTEAGEYLSVEIDVPTTVASGQELIMEVNYENNGKVPIASLEIQLNLPDTFQISATVPEPTKGNDTWTIGSLREKAGGNIKITGTILGSVDTSSTIQAVITYRPSNFNADFQDIKTKEFAIDSSVIETALASPAKALPGDLVEYTLEVTNHGENTLSNVYVDIFTSDAWLFEQTDPALEENEIRWLISELETEKTVELKLQGSFAANTSGLQEIIFQSYFENELGNKLIQTENRSQTDVLGNDLSVQTIINGSGNDQVADPGETLRISINYANTGQDPIGQVGIELNLVGENELDLPIDWQNADINGGQLDPTTNTISWSMSNWPELSTLEPEDKGVIDLSLPILKEFDPSELSDTIKVTTDSSLTTVAGVNSPRQVSSSPLTIKVNSDLELLTWATYFDDQGAPLGSGPLPPKVDQMTAYRLVWQLNNSIHQIKNLEISTTLPLDVAWTGRISTDIGQLSYDPESRVVHWSIDSLPTSINQVESTFEVSITPDSTDIGNFVKLSNRASFSGTDVETEENLTGSVDELSTNLTNDSYAVGKGVVIE
ncbi:MAG: hypothetical protein ABIH67_00210 [Candidatus Uhrbacteria bacterium]